MMKERTDSWWSHLLKQMTREGLEPSEPSWMAGLARSSTLYHSPGEGCRVATWARRRGDGGLWKFSRCFYFLNEIGRKDLSGG